MKAKTIELPSGIILPINYLSPQDGMEYGLLYAYTRQPEYKLRHLPGEPVHSFENTTRVTRAELKIGIKIRNVIANELVASGWKVREISNELGYGYGFSSLRKANIRNKKSLVCKRGHSRELYTITIISKSRNNAKERVCTLCRRIWWRDAEKRRWGHRGSRRKHPNNKAFDRPKELEEII